jgi:hypothetical protein
MLGLRMGVFLVRACKLLAGLSLIGVVIAVAMHIAPPVVYGEHGKAHAYEAGWDLAAILLGFAAVFWIAANLIAIPVVRRMEQLVEAEEDAYED